MSNPRTRATRNESEGFLGYELLGMSQERGSCDGLWVIRENKREENGLERNSHGTYLPILLSFLLSKSFLAQSPDIMGVKFSESLLPYPGPL